jgi:hypothetical protein
LYNIGATQSLIAKDLDSGQNYTYDFSPGNINIPASVASNYNNLYCMTVVTGTQKNPFNITSDVYVGGKNGVFLVKNSTDSLLQVRNLKN